MCAATCALLPNLQPLNSLRSQRHTRHLQPFHYPIPQVLLGRTVLSSALRSQHQLGHHTQPRQRAIRIRQLKTPPRQLMPFRPRLAIRSCTRSDAAQRGYEGVGIDGRFALGFGVVRIVLRLQGKRKSDVFMAMLRTGQTAAPLIKVADGAGSKTGMYQTGGSEDPHAPPAMERERIASRRHTKGDAGRQAHTSGTETGFRVPRHPFPVARQGVLAWLRDAKKP